ncbi:MAG: putative ABC transport system ATP-binding protein [Bradymonadia bacterium]|jgi:putative ABC transport system ATP-binding protein
MSDPMSALIDVHDVHRVYKQGAVEVRALRGVSTEIGAGEFTVLAGPSGSGKTTLLNLIGVLDSATSGRIVVDGTDVTALSRSGGSTFRLHNLGFVFQAYNLIPVLSAYENAEFGLVLQGVHAAEREKRVMPLLDRVGLADQRDRKPHELSGGQQQRIAVVRALATHPKIVLADEPTANLDTKTSIALLDLMSELNNEHDVTFLFASHDDNVIGRAKRVIRLDSGEIIGDERHA